VTIFSPSTDGWENSSLQSGFDDWRMYAYCYRRAAEELAERFPVPLDAPDAMFLPMLYLYRHYVEASLKGILTETIATFSIVDRVRTNHDLSPLWRQVRSNLENRPGILDKSWFDRAESLVEELAKVDPGAMHFRYPVDKVGGKLLKPGFTLSTRHVKDAMGDLCFVLDNLEGYVSAVRDFSSAIDVPA
jgi:hypothetical protein